MRGFSETSAHRFRKILFAAELRCLSLASTDVSQNACSRSLKAAVSSQNTPCPTSGTN